MQPMDPATPDRTYTLDELATLAGVPRRTVRYYIQLGLVDRPIGETRAAYYTWDHLRQLLEVRKLAEQGLSLERIRELRAAPEPTPSISPRRPGAIDVRSHIHLHDGVELVIDAGRAQLSPEQIRSLARDVLAALERVATNPAQDPRHVEAHREINAAVTTAGAAKEGSHER